MAATQPFCFPITVLQNKRMKLVPFCSDRHAPRFFELTCDYPELYAHTANGPYNSADQFIDTFLTGQSYPSIHTLTYAIIDKTKGPSSVDPDGELAGMISYEDADDESFAVVIGHVRTLPLYQSQGIASAATALMLQHALASLNDGGLALCRVEWHSNTMNKASIRVAEKLGFRITGSVSYQRILLQGESHGKIGNGRNPPPRSRPDNLWRDIIMFGVTWEDWGNGVKDKVAELLD